MVGDMPGVFVSFALQSCQVASMQPTLCEPIIYRKKLDVVLWPETKVDELRLIEKMRPCLITIGLQQMDTFGGSSLLPSFPLRSQLPCVHSHQY